MESVTCFEWHGKLGFIIFMIINWYVVDRGPSNLFLMEMWTAFWILQ